jgi:hypothetical protein
MPTAVGLAVVAFHAFAATAVVGFAGGICAAVG